MLKLNIGWDEKRLAQQIAFGLSEGNLQRLQHQPIPIKAEEMGLEDFLGFLLFYSRQEENLFKEDLEDVCKVGGIELEGKQAVLNIEGDFYVAPITMGEDFVYVIALHDGSYKKLRDGQSLTFRARMIEGKGQNIELNIFWGETEEAMAEALGLEAP